MRLTVNLSLEWRREFMNLETTKVKQNCLHFEKFRDKALLTRN